MLFNTSGITTGQLAYSIKNEMFSDSLPFRTLETFNFELYSSDVLNLSPAKIHSGIYNEFISKYSGDINVKVFAIPAEYQIPSDSIRTSKFNVSVEIRNTPNLSGYSELSGNYYKGFDTGFWIQYSKVLVEFKTELSFEKGENGHQSFNHNVSFGLMSGGKVLATQIISGIFANDYLTTLGAAVMVSGISGANPNLVQNYYTESYDLIKNSYSFNKKRDFFPSDASAFNYDLVHSMNLQENGVFDIMEKCNLQGKISFLQASQGLDLVYAGAWTRCNDFYNTYNTFLAQTGYSISTFSVSQLPRKLIKTFNKPSLSASYEVSFTNDVQFQAFGDMVEETIDYEVDNKNIITINDKYNIIFNKRNPNFTSVSSIVNNLYINSSGKIATYYLNDGLYNPNWQLNLIKIDATYPLIKNKANISITYSNNPQNNVTINGINFKTLIYNVENNTPTDIIQEYKIINRPNKLSVLNFPYQSSIGSINVNFTASIGRLSNEFTSGFRNGASNAVAALYSYAIDLFFKEFLNMYPTAFTYYIEDIKYSLSNDGNLNLTIMFKYTIKRVLM